MATNYRRVLNRDLNDIFVATVLLTGPHAAIIYRSSDGRPRRLYFAGLGHCASLTKIARLPTMGTFVSRQIFNGMTRSR